MTQDRYLAIKRQLADAIEQDQLKVTDLFSDYFGKGDNWKSAWDSLSSADREEWGKLSDAEYGISSDQ